jgi:hypothetical protein
MVIDKPVHIEPLEAVQGVIVRNLIRDECVPKDWDQMCCAKDAVDMNNGQGRAASGIEIWGYHPHPCGLINLLGDATEPLYKGTGVRNTQIYKRKEADGTRDLESVNSIEFVVTIDKYAVIALRFPAPQRRRPHNFLSEAVDVAGITGCMERRCCVVEDSQTARESWTGVIEVVVSASVVQLFAQKVAYQPWKVGESKFLGKRSDITRTLSFLRFEVN